MAGTSNMLREWARIGARTRLTEIGHERTRILKAFPELRRGQAGKVVTGSLEQPKRRFSAAAKRRMSAGMKRYWAKRRAAKKDSAT